MNDYDELHARIRRFGEERDWAKFHDPKSLLIAMVGEVGEVAELLQWVPAGEAAARARVEPLQGRVADELADVFIYLVQLADACGVDVLRASGRKLTEAEKRYPIERFRGVAPNRPAAI